LGTFKKKPVGTFSGPVRLQYCLCQDFKLDFLGYAECGKLLTLKLAFTINVEAADSALG
jgi:hypothetical protein